MSLKPILALIVLSAFLSLAHAEKSKKDKPAHSLAAVNINTILVLGDSLSAAYQLPQSKGWVALFQQKLTSLKLKTHIHNASVSGLTTGAALQKLNSLLSSQQPDLVILELGANDGLQGKPLSYIQNNLEKLIKESKKSNAKILLLGVHLPPNLGKRYTEPFFKQYKTLADKYQLGLVEFMLEGVASHKELMLPDGLHPNENGHKKVFEHLWPGLNQAMSSSEPVRY